MIQMNKLFYAILICFGFGCQTNFNNDNKFFYCEKTPGAYNKIRICVKQDPANRNSEFNSTNREDYFLSASAYCMSRYKSMSSTGLDKSINGLLTPDPTERTTFCFSTQQECELNYNSIWKQWNPSMCLLVNYDQAPKDVGF